MEENTKIEFLIMPEKLEWEKLTEVHGKVVIYSLERGFGTTLGNSLRRMLLFCVPGAAITSINIGGVKHEFSSIPGVLEDVPQLIANLKQTIVKIYDEKEGKRELLLDVEGEGEIRAGDIKTDKNVEILNPHLHLATLSKGKSLKISMQAERGKSYVKAKKMAVSDMPIGTIAIDALFSPIKKVDYKVENTRVGDRIDYEKLILEIWTNGSITPDKALEYANKMLIKHYEFVSESLSKKGVKEEIEEEILKEDKKEDKKGLLSKNLSEFDLSVRSMNCLKAGNIKTLGDLLKRTEEDMMQIKNFGKKSLEELNKLLKKFELSFKKTDDK